MERTETFFILRSGLERFGLRSACPLSERRAHGRNAKAWWNAKETWERYDYLYSRDEIKQHAEKIKSAASTPGVKRGM